MSKLFKTTRSVLAANCTLLKDMDQASDVKVGRKGGVAPKTVNNLVNQNTNPTLNTIVGMAEAYGVEPWQLLHPDFKEAMPSETNLEQLTKVLSKLSDVEFSAVIRAMKQDA